MGGFGLGLIPPFSGVGGNCPVRDLWRSAILSQSETSNRTIFPISPLDMPRWPRRRALNVPSTMT